MPIVILILITLILFLLFFHIRIVPQASVYIVERLGKYHATWNAGFHVLIPIIDHVVKKISLKEQVLDFPPQPVITKDNVTMQIDSVVFGKVFNPHDYTYGVENPIAGIQNLAATTLRNIIGEMELDTTLTSRDEINSRMQGILDEATDPWGLKVTRVEIKNIQPPREIEEVMTKQMRAERERRQTILEAQAHKEAVVSRAEGDKQAKILAAEAEKEARIALAEGEAQSIRLTYEAEAAGIRMLNESGISDPVLKLRGIEALKDVADGRATKIFIPSDIADTISAIGAAGEALGIGDYTKIDRSEKPEAPLPKDACIDKDTGKGGVEASKTTEGIERDLENRDSATSSHRSDSSHTPRPLRQTAAK